MPECLKGERVELLRWPIDICAFGLGFGYGVTRLLSSAWVVGTPKWSRLIAYACTTFVSTLVVRRYMPSDERLEPHGTTAVVLWINGSLALSAAIPAIGIFYAETPIFWSALLASTAFKAVHALESARNRSAAKEESLPLATDVSYSRRLERPRSGIERFVFEDQPDAYALRPIFTAVLLTASSSCFAGAVLFGPLRLAAWSVGTFLVCSYAILSGMARGRAIRSLEATRRI